MDNMHRIDQTGTVVNAADVSTATALVSAVTGKRLALRTLIISSDVAAIVTIQDGAASPVVLVPKMNLAANSVLVLYFDPEDARKATVSTAINIIATSGTPDISAIATAYVFDS